MTINSLLPVLTSIDEYTLIRKTLYLRIIPTNYFSYIHLTTYVIYLKIFSSYLGLSNNNHFLNDTFKRENIKWYNKKSMLMRRQEVKRHLRKNALINMLIFRTYAKLNIFHPSK